MWDKPREGYMVYGIGSKNGEEEESKVLGQR